MARYEDILDEVSTDEETFAREVFDHKKAEALFILSEGRDEDFALFFHNFSPYLGRSGLSVEELFVLPEYRGKGYGRALMKKLSEIAVERGCGRMEWSRLDRNQSGAEFYRSPGACPLDEWTTYRLAGKALTLLSK